MLSFFSKILGQLLSLVYTGISSLFTTEPANFSFYAMSIIVTTIIFRLLMLPLAIKQHKGMQRMSEVQPKIKEIEKKYGHDAQTKQQKMMELYKTEKVNPAGSCLPLLIQMPIIFGYFRLLQNPELYAFGDAFKGMAVNFFWIKDLNLSDPYMYGLPLLAAITTMLSSLTMPKTAPDDKAAQTQKMMMFIFPVLIFWSARNFAAGLALYWTVSNIIQFLQQLILRKPPAIDKEVSK